MRLDTIYTSKNASQANITVGRGHLNGVYINSTSSNWKLTVRLRSKNGTTVLIPNMELWRFAYITDYLYGAGGDGISLLSKLVSDLATNTGVAELIAASDTIKPLRTVNSGFMYRLDLGSIFLNDGDEVVIDFTNGGGAALHVSTFSDARSPYELITYELVKDLNATYHKVQSIFCLGGDGASLFDSDITYKVTDSMDTNLVDQVGVFTASRLLGKFEMGGNPDLGLLWANSSGLPESVSVQITGTDAANAELIVIRKEYIQAALSQNTILEAKKKIERVRELEAKEPETAKALRHAGVIEGKADEMAASVHQAEQAAKLD